MNGLRALTIGTLALALAAGCGKKEHPPAASIPRPVTAEQPATGPSTGTAVIEGTVTFKGEPRRAKKIQMGADPACAAIHKAPVLDEKFVFAATEADGTFTLGNAFVWIKSGLPNATYDVPAEPVVLDQNGCRYIPHVMGIQVGQVLEVRNSDATTHNVHSLAKNSDSFNYGQPRGAPALKKTFTASEVMVKLKCDMHPWMTCYVGVLEHPFHAVTGVDGSFAIEGLPAGTYEIAAWQEILKTKTQSITVGDGKTARIEFVFERVVR